MPYVDGLYFTEHGWDQAQERGISTADIKWALNGNHRGVEDGKILCQRWYTDSNNYRWGIFVILGSNGEIITTWVRRG